MTTLFDIQPALPEGFTYRADFITETEEELLLSTIKQFHMSNMKFHEYTAKRKVVSFGNGWSFTEQRLIQGEEIPEAFDFLVKRITDKLSVPYDISQLLITEYPIDSVINWHRDAPPFETIIGV